LSQAANPPSNRFVNVSDRDFCTVARADYRFWELLNYVVQNEPVESLDPVTLGFFASIGIEKASLRARCPHEEDSDRGRRVGDATARHHHLPEPYT